MRDVDRTPPVWFVDAFCRYTGVDRKTATEATLRTYKHKLFDKNRISGHQQWILTLSQSGTKRRAYGQQFCSACLADDLIPYFRKQWRIALFTYCPDHHIELHDACPYCDSPVVFYRVDFGRDVKDAVPIYACHACGRDLRVVASSPVYFPSAELKTSYDNLLNSLCDTGNAQDSFDLEYLVVLHQICKVIGSRNNKGRLLEYVSEQIDVPSANAPKGRITIEELRRHERHLWLLSALWLVGNVEQRLYGAWKEKAVRYNLLTKDLEVMPGWYRRFLKSISNWRDP